jgi:hypothetical protein
MIVDFGILIAESIKTASGVIQKFLSFICHSGLDPESSVCGLDSRWSSPRTLDTGRE